MQTDYEMARSAGRVILIIVAIIFIVALITYEGPCSGRRSRLEEGELDPDATQAEIRSLENDLEVCIDAQNDGR